MPLPAFAPEDTLTEVRTKIGDGTRYLMELRSTPADKRGDSFAEDLRAAVEFVNHGDVIERGLRIAATPEPVTLEVAGSRGFGASLGDREFRSIGEQVVTAEGYKRWAEEGRGQPFVTEVRNLVGGFTTGAYDSGADGWLPVGSPTMVPGSMQRRRAFVRDLLNVSPTGLKVVPYVREANQVTNETGANMTSEGSAKNEVTFDTETYNAVIEKITAYLPVTDELMSDAPTLAGYINGRLEYMLMIREEQQILAGTGSTPQIQGLATLSGTQTQALVTAGGESPGGDFAQTIGRAFGKIENVDGDADGVVANPLDFWAAVTSRHANQFDNGFSQGAPGAVGNVSWGERVIRTRALTSGTAWAGSWALGATLFDREQTTIRVGDQHADYFVRNIKVVLAEKRIGVAWHRPNLFVKCTVPAG